MDLSGPAIPCGWTLRSIDDVCERVTSGGTPSRRVPEFYSEGTWPWVKTQELHDAWLQDTEEYITEEALQRSSAKVLPKNTVLLAMYGATVGKLALLAREMTCNQACCALITDGEQADYRFLYYALLNARPQLMNLAVGAAQQNLSAATIKSLRFAFPSVPEQRCISSTLGALDDKIQLNRKIQATLEAIARALFKSWFVDFDPVRAKADGRDTGLPPRIAALFPNSFVHSELGDIPSNWEVGSIKAVASISSGKRPPHRFPRKGAEHQIEIWGGNGPMAFIEEPLLNEPILLTGRVGTLGSVFRISKPIWPSDNTLVIRPKPPFFEYVFFALLGIDYNSLNRGSTQPLLTQSDLNAQRLIIPDRAVVNEFSRIVSVLFARVDSAGQESDALSLLRDTLLPRLISGELRVRTGTP